MDKTQLEQNMRQLASDMRRLAEDMMHTYGPCHPNAHELKGAAALLDSWAFEVAREARCEEDKLWPLELWVDG